MQNKANFCTTKMNGNKVLTKDYENEQFLRTPEKQTQSKPTCSELAEPVSNGPFTHGKDKGQIIDFSA
jgi:hypothetical protein